MAGFDDVTDKFFLPTSSELGDNEKVGGTRFAYFDIDGQTKRIKYAYDAKTSAQFYLTGAYRIPHVSVLWCVLGTGLFYGHYDGGAARTLSILLPAV